MRATSLKTLTVAAVAVATVMSGCSCGGPEPECLGIVITPLVPTEGAVVDADVDPATAGYQVDVSAEVADKCGNEIEISSATLQHRRGTDDGWVRGPEVQIDGKKITFPAVTFPSGAVVARIQITGGPNETFGQNLINFTVFDPNARPEVTAFTFKGDVNDDGVLNRAELADGTAPTAVIEVANVEDGQQVQVQDAVTRVLHGTAAVASGVAEVQLSALPDIAAGQYELVAVATNARGLSNKIAEGTPEDPLNEAAFKSLTIDRDISVTMILNPTETLFGAKDDADPALDGFQLDVNAQVAADAEASVSISIGGIDASANHVAGTVLHQVTLKASGTTEYTLRISARDAAGNVAAALHTFTVDYDPPVIDITAPLAANGPYADFSQTVSATVSGAADGQMVDFFTRLPGASAETPLVSVPVSNGLATATATFPGGVRDLIAKVWDLAGNGATDIEPQVEVQGQGCSVQLTNPAASPALLMSSDDVNPTMSGLQIAVAGNSANCANKQVRLLVDGVQVAAVNTNGAGDFSAPLSLADGDTKAIRAEMTHDFGKITFDETVVTVDLSAPAITAPVNNAVLNTTRDLQEALPGAQVNLSYAPAAASAARIDVCTNVPFGNSPTACPDGAAGWHMLATNVPAFVGGFTFPESAYQVKLVEVAGTSFNVSAPIAVTADTVVPSVTALTFQGDANADNRLNASESPSGNPVALLGASEPLASARVQPKTGGTPYGTGTPSGSAASVAMTLPNTEADYELVAVVTDLAGNQNVIANPTTVNPLNAAAFVTFRLDRVAPTITVQLPSKATLGNADDADPVAAGFQLLVRAVTAPDVKLNGATFKLSGGFADQAKTPDGSGSASATFVLPATGETTHTINIDAADESGNPAQPAQMTVTVDRNPPAVTIVAPTAAGGPYGQYTQTTLVNVTGAEGQTVRIYSAVGSSAEVLLGALPAVSGGVASGAITYPDGMQTIRAEVGDAAANTASDTEAGVVVNGVGCSILVFSPSGSPAYLNKAADGNAATAATFEGAVSGSSSNCPDKQVRLYDATGSSRTLIAGPVSSGTNGAFTLPFALAEGTYVLQVEMDNGAGVLTTSNQQVVVDLSAPALTNVSPAASNGTVYFVASSNVHVRNLEAGYVADGVAGGDAQVNVNLTASDAIGGSAVVVFGSQTVGGPVSIASSPQTLSIPATLTHNSSGSFVVRITDAAGNVTSQSATGVVDVREPAAPIVAQNLVSGQERTARVALQWPATFDDGADSSSGATQGYDLRWTTNAVTETGIATEADYFSATLVKKEPTVAWVNGSTSTTITVPPLATYWIAVRAVDEVGNYSPFAAPVSLQNYWSTAVMTNPSGSSGQYFGFIMNAGGSINGDSVDDLIVTSILSGPGAVYVYFGGSAFSSAAPQALAPPASPPAPDNDNAGQYYGTDVSVGHSSDAPADLLVSSPMWGRPNVPAYAGSTGRAFLYFGGTQPIDTNTFVEFRGNQGTQLGTAAQIIPDINGDAYAEVALAANAESGGQGRVYIFYGRPKGSSTTVGSWLYLQATSGGFVPMSAANIVIEGRTPVATGTNHFGRGRALMGVGNLDGAGPSEFVVPSVNDQLNRLHVFAGEVRGLTAPQKVLKTGDLPTPNDALQTLTADGPLSGSRYGLGFCGVGRKNFVGQPASDLVATAAKANKAQIFADGSATGFAATPVTITGPENSYFGFSCAAGDLNQDGSPDIAVGENPTSPTGKLWVFYNQAGVFDPLAGAGFAHSKLPGNALGVSSAVGDFNGDGKPDIAAGDHRDGAGRVIVWF